MADSVQPARLASTEIRSQILTKEDIETLTKVEYGPLPHVSPVECGVRNSAFRILYREGGGGHMRAAGNIIQTCHTGQSVFFLMPKSL